MLPGPYYVSWLGSSPASRGTALFINELSRIISLRVGSVWWSPSSSSWRMSAPRSVLISVLSFTSLWLWCLRSSLSAFLNFYDDLSCSLIIEFSHFREWISFMSFLTITGSSSSFFPGEADYRSFVIYFRYRALSSTIELQVVLPLKYLVRDASAMVVWRCSLPCTFRLSSTISPGSTFSVTSLYSVIGFPNMLRCYRVGARSSRL